MHLLETASD